MQVFSTASVSDVQPKALVRHSEVLGSRETLFHALREH